MKKLSAIIICLLMIVTCSLAGCATFAIDKVKYYNEVLAKVGDTNITRFEVLNAYNSYGNSYYVQQMGQSEKEAIESTLDLLIDREALYQYGKTEAKFKPNAAQVNAIIEEIFSSLDEQMKEYVTTAKNILNIKVEDEAEDEETTETAATYENYVYTPRASIVSNKTYYTDSTKTVISSTQTSYYTETFSIEYIIPEEEQYTAIIDESFLEDYTKSGIVDEIKTEYLSKFRQGLIDNEELTNVNAIYNKAIDLLVKDLMSYEQYLLDSNGNHYNKVTNDLIYRYFERNFNSQIKSQYLENIRLDYVKQPNTLSTSAILEKFDSLLTSSYSQYVNRNTSYKNKMKDIGTDGDTILYHPSSKDGTKFGYFIHTLLNFSDSQKEEIKLLDKNDVNYSTDYAEIVGKTEVEYRNANGEVVGTKGLTEIVNEYQEICAIPDYNERMNAFIQFMFTYTGDTGTMNAGMPYVVGTNGFSSMVEEFTNESIALMEQGVGSMSAVDLSDIDTLCITTYGIHFVFYVESVDAYDFDYDTKDSVKIEDLKKQLNPLTGETYFDMLFDAVYPASSEEEVYTSNNGYTAYENGIVENIKAANGVVKYATKIANTKTSLN